MECRHQKMGLVANISNMLQDNMPKTLQPFTP